MPTKELSTFFLTLCIFIASSQLGIGSPVENATELGLEKLVLEGISQNQSQFTCGWLTWSHVTHENEFTPGRKVDLKGSYEYWWDNDKVAVKYLEEKVVESRDKTKREIRENGQIKTFDGKEFRAAPNRTPKGNLGIAKLPDFGRQEDWMQIIGWKVGGFVQLYRELQVLSVVELKWSLVRTSDGERIRLNTRNIEDGTQCQQDFDPRRGFCLVDEQFTTGQGQVYMKNSMDVQKFGNGWLPVAVNGRVMEGEKITLHHQYSLDLKNCNINDRTILSDAIFTIPIEPDMDISDYRGGARINYSQKIQPQMETLVDGAKSFLGGGVTDAGVGVADAATVAEADYDKVTVRRSRVLGVFPRSSLVPGAMAAGFALVLGILFFLRRRKLRRLSSITKQV